MQMRNQKIIDAIIEKANRECPGSLAMIGIYGSFCTGDIHEKSDLDLMILINDEKGYSLSHTFVLEDECIGHDLYCTTWEALEHDSHFGHPNISKLMDSKIVYCADDAYMFRLEALKARANTANTAEAAEKTLQEARERLAQAMTAEGLANVRFHAVGTILSCQGAIALRNGKYFRLGTRRVFEELGAMEHVPENLQELVDRIVAADSCDAIKAGLITLLQAVEKLFVQPLPEPQIYPGTCEEMISNWRNKMFLAARTGDRWLAISSMTALDAMLKELGFDWNVMDRFHPDDLNASAAAYDDVIARYQEEYRKAGVPFQSYPNVDAFVEEYTKKKA